MDHLSSSPAKHNKDTLKQELQVNTNGIFKDTYLLLTEFEVRTVSYGASFFFPVDLWG